MPEGKVKWLMTKKDLVLSSGGGDVFVHHSSIQGRRL